MTSGTKYIGGHGDVTLGMLAVRGQELAKRVYFLQARAGRRRRAFASAVTRVAAAHPGPDP